MAKKNFGLPKLAPTGIKAPRVHQPYGESQAVTRPGPTAAMKFGMPGLPQLPSKVTSGVSGVPSLSAVNRKSVTRFGA